MHKLNSLIYLIIAILVISISATNISGDQADQADQADVMILGPPHVYIGDPYKLFVYVYPNGTEISGIQIDLEYDPTKTIINSIHKGDLFESGSHDDTYFIDGTFDYGAINNIYAAILGPYSISDHGSFVVINVTAINPGEAEFKLSNIIIASQNATQINSSAHNISIVQKEYPPYDVNKDGIINILDLVMVASHFGEMF